MNIAQNPGAQGPIPSGGLRGRCSVVPDTEGNAWGERGSASVEFLAFSVLVLVPLVYLIITLATIQAAAFAAHSSVRDVGRILATTQAADGGAAAADQSVRLAFADHGMSVDPAQSLTIRCSDDACESGFATIAVSVEVPLPWMPLFLADSLGLKINISSETMTVVGPIRTDRDAP